jgi:hypothetical protein
MEFEIVVSLIQEADASEIIIRKRSDNTMSKKKVDKRTNNDLHEPTNTGVISCGQKGLAVPTPLVRPSCDCYIVNDNMKSC